MLRSEGTLPVFRSLKCISDNILEGKQIVFVTNNSTKSREDYRKKLESMGIPAKVVCSDNPLPP